MTALPRRFGATVPLILFTLPPSNCFLIFSATRFAPCAFWLAWFVIPRCMSFYNQLLELNGKQNIRLLIWQCRSSFNLSLFRTNSTRDKLSAADLIESIVIVLVNIGFPISFLSYFGRRLHRGPHTHPRMVRGRFSAHYSILLDGTSSIAPFFLVDFAERWRIIYFSCVKTGNLPQNRFKLFRKNLLINFVLSSQN